MADRQYHLKFDGSGAAAVDSYLEYKRIVGDDDGGQMFTPQEYEAYKKKKAKVRTENRLFVSWSNSAGMDCKLVGPETECFCQHRYRQHKTDFETIPTDRPILQPCQVKGCKCVSYEYTPGMTVRCKCKHSTEDHSVIEPHKCKKANCQCSGFKTAYTCGCGEPAYEHRMIVETKEERQARGHPVGRDTLYQAMGGLTGFSSLMDGYARLDSSGQANEAEIEADLAERMSAMKKPGESDMDYYERRYQERLKAEKKAVRGAVATRGRRQPLPKPKNSKTTGKELTIGGAGLTCPPGKPTR